MAQEERGAFSVGSVCTTVSLGCSTIVVVLHSRTFSLPAHGTQATGTRISIFYSSRSYLYIANEKQPNPYLIGLDHQICRLGDCLLMTHVPRSPTTMFSTPCCTRANDAPVRSRQENRQRERKTRQTRIRKQHVTNATMIS